MSVRRVQAAKVELAEQEGQLSARGRRILVVLWLRRHTGFLTCCAMRY